MRVLGARGAEPARGSELIEGRTYRAAALVITYTVDTWPLAIFHFQPLLIHVTIS